MSKIDLIILFILFSTGSSMIPMETSAQGFGTAATMMVDGYVILSNGDTLNGEIRWRLKYVENNPVEIKFTAENGNSKIFKAGEIQGFGNYIKITKTDFDTPIEFEPEHYVSRPSFKKEIPVFYNRLLDGRIKVFQNRSSLQFGGDKTEEISEFDGLAFSFSRDEGLTIGPTYRTSFRIIEGRIHHSSYFITKDNETLLKVRKENYESVFEGLFDDCPEIIEELVKNPDLRNFKNFMLLVELYNHLCALPVD